MSTGYFEFWFRSRVVCAAGSIVRLPALLESYRAKRAVLLSDKGLKQAGVVDRVAQVFADHRSGNLPQLAGVYAEISPDAGSRTINAALRFAREVAADSIIALGGGSVLDAAKGVKYALASDLTDICDALESGLRFDFEGAHMGVPHIAIPTTAGTGAEVTNGAIIFNERTGIKVPLLAPFLEADCAVLDAELTLGLPSVITADTGMDALTHAVEAIVNPAATHFSDALAFQAADIILKSLPVAVRDGRNLQAREDMLQAATMACLALANAVNAAPVHNCSHALGALYHIPHGRANGVLLPIVMEELPEFYFPYANRLARAFGIATSGEAPESVVRSVVARIRTLQQAIGMPLDLAGFNIPPTELERIAVGIAMDPLAMFYRIPPERSVAIATRAIGPGALRMPQVSAHAGQLS